MTGLLVGDAVGSSGAAAVAGPTPSLATQYVEATLLLIAFFEVEPSALLQDRQMLPNMVSLRSFM